MANNGIGRLLSILALCACVAGVAAWLILGADASTSVDDSRTPNAVGVPREEIAEDTVPVRPIPFSVQMTLSVVDAFAGSPIVRASVSCDCPDKEHSLSTCSNEAGECQFQTPGDCLLCVSAPGYQSVQVQVQGEQQQVRLTGLAVAGFEVVDALGHPVAQANLDVVCGPLRLKRSQSTGIDGRATMAGLPSDAVYLAFAKHGPLSSCCRLCESAGFWLSPRF
jgi:hypothetical protein